MAFINVHGLKIAKNGYIENLIVEKLTALPTDLTEVAEGRLFLVDSRLYTIVVKNDVKEALDITAGNTEVISDLEARITALEAKDTEIDGKITALEAKDTEIDGKLASYEAKHTEYEAKHEEIINRFNDYDSQLNDFVGGITYTFKSETPNTSFVLAHNLNSEFVEVITYTKDEASGKYLLAIVPVEITDANTVTLELTEAKDVLVIVRRAFVKTAEENPPA